MLSRSSFLFLFGIILAAFVAGRSLPQPDSKTLKSESNPDRIESLPGWGSQLPSAMYSGYLDVGTSKHLHYVFVESERDPGSDPVVIWLNGGPGCSSLDGFIYENGPFIVDPHDRSKLVLRPIRWSQIANVLFIEAPVGVGFSYSDDPKTDYKCNDDQTAHDNAEAVMKFYELYPQFKNQDLYITGESYAGIYVPTLAETILAYEEAGNYTGAPLKGIAVGNGCSGSELGICGFSDQGTYYEFEYLLGTAFISSDLKVQINQVCNWTDAKNKRPLSSECHSLLDAASAQIGHINLYNIYGDCVSDDDYLKKSNGLLHSKVPRGGKLSNLGGPDACIDSRAASAYFNQPEVMEAFHVKNPGFTWAVCMSAPGWSYQSTRPNLPRDTYPKLVQNLKVLIYNGDWDACVPFTDNQAWTQNMGYHASESWHAWKYTTPDGLDNQVGGYAVKYDVPNAKEGSWFRFITVRGGRHEVPESVPDKALVMLERFINGGEF